MFIRHKWLLIAPNWRWNQEGGWWAIKTNNCLLLTRGNSATGHNKTTKESKTLDRLGEEMSLMDNN